MMACQIRQPTLTVLDTDFSKGRLINKQMIGLQDLEKFHGHRCDGLVMGFLALRYSIASIYSDSIVDRTNLRIISKPSPCLTDVAVYITGGRYQFNTFYTSADIPYMYEIQRIDTKQAWGIKLKPNIFPNNIKILGNLAIEGKLDSCELKNLKTMEDDFSNFLLKKRPEDLFIIEEIQDFNWTPENKNNFLKTDVINKMKEPCL